MSSAVRISELWGMGRNPDRRWWTFWRPRWVMMKRTEIERFARG